jgi:hypothetical protein
VRDTTAGFALVGTVVALVTGRPAIEVAKGCDARKPLARTNNGTLVER